MKRFPWPIQRPLLEEEHQVLLAVLVKVARENGVTWGQVEEALGPEYAARHKAWILGVLQAANVKVETPLRSLADSPVSGFAPYLLEKLNRIGIKTWRDLFTADDGELFKRATFFPDDVFEVRHAVCRTGYRFGMTSEEVDARAVALSDVFATPLLQLGLSTRPLNALYNCNATTLGDICALTQDFLRSLRNFGRNALAEVESMVERHGLSLGMIVPGAKIAKVASSRSRGAGRKGREG